MSRASTRLAAFCQASGSFALQVSNLVFSQGLSEMLIEISGVYPVQICLRWYFALQILATLSALDSDLPFFSL